MKYYGIDWLAMCCGLLGAYLLGNRNRFAFVLFMTASLSWSVIGFLTNSIALSFGSSIFFVLHLRGFFKWRNARLIDEATQ